MALKPTRSPPSRDQPPCYASVNHWGSRLDGVYLGILLMNSPTKLPWILPPYLSSLFLLLLPFLCLSFSEVTQKPIFFVAAEEIETSKEFDWQLSLSLPLHRLLSLSLSRTHTHAHTHTHTHAHTLLRRFTTRSEQVYLHITRTPPIVTQVLRRGVKNQPFLKNAAVLGVWFVQQFVCLLSLFNNCLAR